MRRVFFALVAAALASSSARAQSFPTGPIDPLSFSQLKDFGAFRSSSNNSDPNSNDDSKRPIPGETVTLADLEGPGIVTHIWITIAANEYGWPRLLRLRVYYDGSQEASVDAPIGDFFAVGHGFERPVNSVMIRNGSAGRARNSYWPMPFRRSCRITVTNEGRRRVNNLYYHVDWEKVRDLPATTGYFPRDTGSSCPRLRTESLTCSWTSRAGDSMPAPCCRSCRRRRVGSARGTITSTWTAGTRRRSKGRDRRTISTTRGAFTSRRVRTSGSPSRRAPDSDRE